MDVRFRSVMLSLQAPIVKFVRGGLLSVIRK